MSNVYKRQRKMRGAKCRDRVIGEWVEVASSIAHPHIRNLINFYEMKRRREDEGQSVGRW
jgi:hypothetical protein